MAGMSISEALKQYGYVGTLANSVPELKKLLARAASGRWSVEEFTRSLQDSKWWKNSSDSVKQYQVLWATKPGEARQQQNNMIGKVRTIAAEMGVSLSEGANGTLSHLVKSAMQMGWDEGLLRQNIANYWRAGHGHALMGSAAETGQKLKEIYSSYGITYSEDSIARALKLVLMGRTSLESYRSDAMLKAKSKYAGFARQIDEGATVKDIADPYIQSMSTVLELPSGGIDLYDKSIQAALTSRAADGTPQGQPLWQFEQKLRDDPRWNKTKNAANSAYGFLRQIGNDWGFGG